MSPTTYQVPSVSARDSAYGLHTGSPPLAVQPFVVSNPLLTLMLLRLLVQPLKAQPPRSPWAGDQQAWTWDLEARSPVVEDLQAWAWALVARFLVVEALRGSL